MNSVIVGSGLCLPEKVVTNFDLSKIMDTSDEWIRQRTGIEERHVVVDNETTSVLATRAAQNAIENAGISPDDVDLIIVGTVTPDYTFPSVATLVQRNLGVKQGAAFDLSAACSGFVYALDIADSYIKLGKAKCAIIIGAETFSKVVDWSDRTTSILFGDGAGAVVLQAKESDRGVVGSRIFSDGQYAESLITTGGVSVNQIAGVVKMDGREVFRHAVEKMKSAIDVLLNDLNLTYSDIDILIPHQANLRIINMLKDQLKMSDDQVIVTVDKHANTSAATIPLALASSYERLIGKNVLLVSMGAGFTWGASFIRM